MADFQVRLNQGNNYRVSQEKTVVAEFLSDLADVSVSDLPSKGNHILSYNATTQRYELVPADQVLQTAADDAQLPAQFIQQLEVDLDNQIDLDAGTF
jgi:hypothetical protein